jgi:hypothetical protein
VPKHLRALSVSLAHAIVNAKLRRTDILAAVSTLCRYRWRALCLRSAHRSISPYPQFPAKGPLYDDYSTLLGEPYVSPAKVAAFGLICVDRAVAHSDRGNTAKSHFYAANASRAAHVFGASNKAAQLREKRTAGTRTKAEKDKKRTEKRVAKLFRKLRTEGCNPRSIKKTIALTLKLTPQHVGRVIKELNLA